MRERVLLLTGSPGVGKTTVLLRAVESLKARGCRIGGVISREVRSHGKRVGFDLVDVGTGRSGWLAHVDQKVGPQVGKYRVNLVNLDGIGAEAIRNAVEVSEVVAIDEIGPMELFSEKFKQAAREAVESTKMVICVVHWKARSRLIDEIERRGDVEMYEVDYGNREDLPQLLTEKATSFLGNAGKQ